MRMDKTKGLMISIADGLTGYMSYQARCGMSEAYSEYLLYDPIVRIVKDKWKIRSEYSVIHTVGRGDDKRIDFFIESTDKKIVVALEVKWLPSKLAKKAIAKKKPNKSSVSFDGDLKKLRAIKADNKGKDVNCFMVLAGKHMKIEDSSSRWESTLLRLPYKIKDVQDRNLYYQTVYECQHSRYGVTIIEVE